MNDLVKIVCKALSTQPFYSRGYSAKDAAQTELKGKTLAPWGKAK